MKILLFGKSGQVGWELQRSLAPLGEIVAPDIDDAQLCGNLRDPAGVARTVATVRPDAVVNAAAYTAVDQAEAQPELARTINAMAVQTLAQAAQQVGALMVHYSTDYVFDGSGHQPWREDDACAPLNVYGATKLEGERLIQAVGGRYLILRTSWVYGARGLNFARTMLRLAGERPQLQVVDDQIGAPTGADLLADVTAHALRATMLQAELAGLYHVAASGETSWCGYARYLLERAAAAGIKLKAGAGAVQAIPSAHFPAAARRPLNSRLDTGSLRQRFRLTLPPWQAGVARMLSEILSP